MERKSGNAGSSNELKRKRNTGDDAKELRGDIKDKKRLRIDNIKGQSEQEKLSDLIKGIEKNEVPNIFAMAIENLENRKRDREDQLRLSSMDRQTRSYSSEIGAYTLAIKKFEGLKEKYFEKGEIKENKIEEAETDIQRIIEENIYKTDNVSIKAIEAIRGAIDKALNKIWTWSERFGSKEYDATFAAIRKSTYEKIQSSMVVGDLFLQLKAQGAFGENSEVKILDIGSHDGDTLRKILGNSGKLGSVSLYGIDYQGGIAEKFKTELETLKFEGITVSS